MTKSQYKPPERDPMDRFCYIEMTAKELYIRHLDMSAPQAFEAAQAFCDFAWVQYCKFHQKIWEDGHSSDNE